MGVPPVLAQGGDIGPLHVLLAGPDGREIAAARARPDDGYTFAFEGMARLATYRLTAGTDLDGDGNVDEAGEAAGSTTGAAGAPADAGAVTLPIALVPASSAEATR
jgi:hypothetical protein